MQITLQVRNAQLVGKGLANIRAEIPRISERTIKKAADKIVKTMKIYPSKRPGQRYVRTFRFQNSWRIKRSATGFTISANPIDKGTNYGRYVVGDFAGTIGSGGQAWMHVGRWLLFRDVAEREVSQLPPMVEEQVRMKVKQEGLAP